MRKLFSVRFHNAALTQETRPMYASIRHAFAAFCSQQVADLTTELGSLRNQLCSLRKSRDEWRRECQHVSARLALAESSSSRRLPPASLPGKRNLRSPNLRTHRDRATAGGPSPCVKPGGRAQRLRGEVRQSQHELDMSRQAASWLARKTSCWPISIKAISPGAANWRSKNAARPTPSRPRR